MTDQSTKTAGDAQNETETDPRNHDDIEIDSNEVNSAGVDVSGGEVNRDDVDGTDSTQPTARNSAGGTLYETRPTLKPTLIVLGAATALWAALFGVLVINPELVGTAELTRIVEIVIHLTFAFILIRLGARLYVLCRITYQVNEDHIAREYSLLFRYRRREVPIERIRATEVRRDPLETLLGYGTLAVLTAGVNRSLGFVEFENVPKPDAVRDAIKAARSHDT